MANDIDEFTTLLDSVVHAAYQVARSEVWTAEYDRAELANARLELEQWVFALTTPERTIGEK